MSRDNLTRPVGNPVNLDAQPKAPLEMQWPAASDPTADRLLIRSLIIGLLLITSIPPATRYAINYFSPNGEVTIWVIVFLLILIHVRNAFGYSSWLWVLLSVFAVFVTLNPAGFFHLSCVVFALLTLFLAYSFQKHYITICSAAPLDKAAAAAFQKSGTLPTAVKPSSFKAAAIDAITNWLTYNQFNHNAAGIRQSPAGSQNYRFSLTAIAVTLTTATVHFLFSFPPESLQPVLSRVEAKVLYLIPIPFLLLCITLPSFNRLRKAHALKQYATLSNCWPKFIADIRQSANAEEADSFFYGQVKHDGSPILIPSKSEETHQWLSASTGGGKTTYLMMKLEQLIARGYSVLCLDLKADSYELLHTLKSSGVPCKYLTNRLNNSTYLFSPFRQTFWPKLSVSQRTDILLSTMGLQFFTRGYGESYFSDVCYHLLDHVIAKYPDIASFQELNQRMAYEIANASPSELSATVKKDGEHVAIIINRLAKTEFFNFAAATSQQQNSALQLRDLFESQGLVYAALNCLTAPTASPELARVIFGSVMACATTTRNRNNKLVIVIDEFQQLASPNQLQLALRQCRSLSITILLANQDVTDLQQGNLDFSHTVETNTATQIWLKTAGREGTAQIQKLGGKVIDYLHSKTVTHSENGASTGYSTSEVLVDRFQAADIAKVGADDSSFIIRITDDRSYAQYSGLPFIATCDYHLSFADYQARTQADWPGITPETIVVTSTTSKTSGLKQPINPSTGPPRGSAIRSGTIGIRNRP